MSHCWRLVASRAVFWTTSCLLWGDFFDVIAGDILVNFGINELFPELHIKHHVLRSFVVDVDDTTVYRIKIVHAPEPGSLMLLSFGLTVCAASHRRRTGSAGARALSRPNISNDG